MTDQELEHLIVTELESKRLDFTYSKDITEFFDKAFPEYDQNY
ncbi:hypothetical protein [Streptococcus mutans]|uniref:Uncharacterized protein n=1 Tax=Streptococcus mutans SM6 TaxID=857119 RepID=A0A829BPB0_STRMG|nr:hypothetical protein [Streptococcus mutans]EMB97397.1 hypothetical protein SMU62_03510 [Streptococcus mutans M21]EMC23975.1 hypothetical protein SMU82_05407 [Streptococcus mutans SM6]VTY48446.1 Uncharacterised protein [Streptococcus mutans]